MLVTDWSGQSSSGLSAALMAYCGTSPTAIASTNTVNVPTVRAACRLKGFVPTADFAAGGFG